jgi:glycosyltransferase involved in cell wall biosynthesis
MRLLYVITQPGYGGAQVHVLSLVRQAQARGWPVMVLTAGAGWLTERLSEIGVDFQLVSGLANPRRPSGWRGYRTALKQAVAEFKPDVVHFHGLNSFLGLWFLRHLPQPRTIATVHGWSISVAGATSRFSQFVYQAAMRWLLPLADCVVYVCKRDQAHGVRWGFSRRSRSAVVYNGVPPTAAADRAKARERLGLPSGAFVVGTVGRLVYQKNLDLLLAVAARPELADAHFVIVGDGPERNRLESQARELGLVPKRCRLVGAYPAAQVLRAFDVFVLTSSHEAFPYTVLEAAQAGVPVVATAVGGVGEFVEDGVTGRLVPSGDAGAFAKALVELQGDSILADRLAAAALDRVNRDFTEAAMFDRLVKIYDGPSQLADNSQRQVQP